ncbi:MAG TPA: hypothetical protein VFX59_22405 [Polyangiales bacterium]|nr:hypothetical protein [Polyangiales bacterium]
MQASHVAFRALVPAATDDARRAAQPASLAGELAAALAITARHGALGDAFVFGRCQAEYERALASTLPADTRVFGCAEGRPPRGRTFFEARTFDDRAVAALRARHYVQRVSVVVVADDFSWSLGRVVHGLRSLLAPHAVLLVAGRQAALLETLWLDELRGGQRELEVAAMREPASSWARLTLRRRSLV